MERSNAPQQEIINSVNANGIVNNGSSPSTTTTIENIQNVSPQSISPPMPTMHHFSPYQLYNMNMNMNMNINMMNQGENNTMHPMPTMNMASLPMPIPVNINNIRPSITEVPIGSPDTSKTSNTSKTKKNKDVDIIQQIMMQPPQQHIDMNMNQMAMNQMAMNNPMLMNANMNQQLMMQQQLIMQQMMQQQNMNMFQTLTRTTNECTLNSIGRDTKKKFSIDQEQSLEKLQKLQQLSQLEIAKRMYEEELQKLHSMNQLPSNYKKPAFPDLSEVTNNNDENRQNNNNNNNLSPSSGGISSGGMWTPSPITISPTNHSVSPPQPKQEEVEIAAPTDNTSIDNNDNDEQKEKETSENDIVTIVGGRAVTIPPIHYVPNIENTENEEKKINDGEASLLSLNANNANNTNKTDFCGLNSLKGLPDLGPLRSYSLSNGFNLRQRAEQRHDLRKSRLKRSRTTFEVRGHSGQKMKQKENKSHRRTLRDNRGHSIEQKTTLLTLNDISANDPHVQRGVRRMLRNVGLMKKRSLSCISLSSVKE